MAAIGYRLSAIGYMASFKLADNVSCLTDFTDGYTVYDARYALAGHTHAFSDHGALTGLADDDHTQYALLAGRAGGQVLIGGTASGNDLTLQSTSHATKGTVFFGAAGTSGYDEVNDRLGIGTATPADVMEVKTSIANAGVQVVFTGTSSASVGPVLKVLTNDGSAMESGHRIGSFAFGGYDGTANRFGPLLLCSTTEAWSGTARGSKFEIFTIANTTTAQARVVVFDQDQSALFYNFLKSNHATAGLGYATGAGGTVTQATSKSTGVTLNKVCGTITMNNAALAANTTVSFVLTNSAIAAGDLLVLNHVSGGTPGSYLLNAQRAAGSATIDVRNISAGSLSEAIVIGFAVIKGVTA